MNSNGNSAASQGRPLVRLRNLSKSFDRVEAVCPLNLDIFAGDFFAVLGPSGCGKTTMLRLIGGFVTPTSGTIEIDGTDVTRLGPERRPTNMVFQGYGLFPHMTVRQNIGYGLRIAKVAKAEVDARVADVIGLVRLEELADRDPQQLSGGQQQRVALARALVMRPKVLLLDEPLGALDLKLRQAMQEELRRIHDQIGGTFVFVTHDQGEALGLANRIAVMEQGELVQDGGPEEIYARPRTRFVSTFIGEANLLAGNRLGNKVRLDAGVEFADAGGDAPVITVVRPEAVRIGSDAVAADVQLTGELHDTVFLGAYVKYQVRLAGGQLIAVHHPDPRLRERLERGGPVTIGWSLDDHRVIEDKA